MLAGQVSSLEAVASQLLEKYRVPNPLAANLWEDAMLYLSQVLLLVQHRPCEEVRIWVNGHVIRKLQSVGRWHGFEQGVWIRGPQPSMAVGTHEMLWGCALRAQHAQQLSTVLLLRAQNLLPPKLLDRRLKGAIFSNRSCRKRTQLTSCMCPTVQNHSSSRLCSSRFPDLWRRNSQHGC